MSDVTPPIVGQDPWGDDLNAYLASLEAQIPKRFRFDMSNPAHRAEFEPFLLGMDGTTGELWPVEVSVVEPNSSFARYQTEALQMYLPQRSTVPGDRSTSTFLLVMVGLDPARFGAAPGDIVEISTMFTCKTVLHAGLGAGETYPITPQLDQARLYSNNVTGVGAGSMLEGNVMSEGQWNLGVEGYVWAGTSGYTYTMKSLIHVVPEMMSPGPAEISLFGVFLQFCPIWHGNDFTVQLLHSDITVQKKQAFTSFAPAEPGPPWIPAQLLEFLHHHE